MIGTKTWSGKQNLTCLGKKLNQKILLFYWNNVAIQCVKLSVFGFTLVRVFPYLDWIRRDTPYFSVLSPNVGKCGPE